MTKDQPVKTKIEEETVESFVRESKDKTEDEVLEAEVIEKAVEEPKAEEPEAVEEEEEEVEVDELTALRQQLKAAQDQAGEYLDDLRRERAAFQNYKKRQENERAELWQMAQAEILLQILPTLDDMERALATVPEDQADQLWIEGVALIQRKLQTTLEGAGVVPVEAEPGQPFDPFIHEAVSYEESEDFEESQIIAVLQKGHMLGERVLRPAMVRVAK